MNVLKLAFAIVLMSTARVYASSACAPLIGNCSYYACLSEQMHCQAGDYPEHMAERYCSDFDADLAGYSAKGKIFMGRVKACLQVEIDSTLTPQKTCGDLASEAPSQHVTCYVRSGFCDLSYFDQMRIGESIFATFLSDSRFRRTALLIAQQCGELPR